MHPYLSLSFLTASLALVVVTCPEAMGPYISSSSEASSRDAAPSLYSPLLSPPRVVVAADVISIRPLLLLLSPSLLMNPFKLVIQTYGNDVTSLLV